jgi:GrpB-like predicted nucleotidyltransferase (UPF0157 family)
VLSPRLVDLLHSLDLDPAEIADPVAAWARLHEVHGPRATLVDRYELEEHVRGTPITLEDRARLRLEVLETHYPDLELFGPPSADPVEVVPYDAAWPDRFAGWAKRIAGVLASLRARVEHVGSTAVPGLPAKPVIDVQVSVPSVEDEDAFAPGIESLGLPLRAREPGHRYFRPTGGDPRVVQVHVCDVGGEWERAHLLFRDYLRANEAARDAYADLKRALAARFHDDRLAYNEGKTGFILDALDDAAAWAERTRWVP